MGTRRALAALLLLGLPAIAACQRTGGPAPVTVVSQPADSTAGTVIVQPGDTLYGIARRYGVPLRDLIEANNAAPPYLLEIGDRLMLPRLRLYTVQPGDTVYGISRMVGAGMDELSQLNGLQAPYAVQEGQQLRLPADRGGVEVAQSWSPGGQAPAVRPAAPVQVAAAPPPRAVAPAPAASGPIVLTPAPAAPSAAPPSKVTVQPLAPPPGPSAPAPSTVTAMAPPPVPSAAPTPPPAPAPAPVAAPPPPPPAPAPPPAAAPPAAAAPAPAVAVDDTPPPRSGKRFLWPVKGQVISTYGVKPDGMHNDGINVAAPRGTPVQAADNGVVVYAGNELRGFGNLLLVRHADGFITAYAHLDRMDVQRGATVTRGQPIATVGQTGSVSSPQLHFELRKGSQAVDPRGEMEGA